MYKAVLFSLVVPFSLNLSAFDLPATKASDIKQREINTFLPEIGKPAVSAPAARQSGQFLPLWMIVRNYPAMKEVSARDYSAAIEVKVRKSFDDFDVDLKTDSNFKWGRIRKVFDRDYRLSGSGISLNMNQWGRNYSISGSVRDGEQTQTINLTAYKGFDEFSYRINSSGLSLNIDKNSIDGNFDSGEYSKKAVAAVISLVLAVQVDKSQARDGCPAK